MQPTYSYPPLDWSILQGKSARDILVHPDRRYFLSLLKVPTQSGPRRPGLLPWMHQILWEGVTVREITLKSREVASSTFWVMEKLHKVLLNPGASLLIAADKEDNAVQLMRYVKTMVDTLPAEIRPAIGRSNETLLEFPKLGSYIKALPGTVTSGRAQRGKYLICTEMAFWDKPEVYYGSVQGALVPKTAFDPVADEIAIESTANTQSDLFHDFWMDSENGFTKRFVSVWDNPGHTPEWYAQKRREIKDRFLFLREYPETADQAFTGSADSYVDPDTVAAGQVSIKVPLETRELPRGQGYVHLWKRPTPGTHYVVGADVAEGKLSSRGKPDWSNAKVLNWRTGEHVATIHTRLPDDEYAAVLHDLGLEYNSAFVAVERNGPGLAVIRVLQAKGYENLYFQEALIPGLLGTSSPTRNVGWLTTSASKAPACSDLYAAMKAGEFLSPDAGFWDEAKSFGRQTLKGMGGAHDDQWMSAVIAWQARKSYHPGWMEDGDDQGPAFTPKRSWLTAMPWNRGG